MPARAPAVAGHRRPAATCATDCQGDTDCAPGTHCDNGQCLPNDGLGVPCDEDSDCQHGHCAPTADGTTMVCCNTACRGACEACGSDGICGPGPDGITCGEGGTGACCAGACVDTDTDVAHCGACETICPGSPNGRAVCVAGDCGIECDAGFRLCPDATSCVLEDGGCCTVADCPEDQQCAGDTCVPICLALGDLCTAVEECCQDALTVCGNVAGSDTGCCRPFGSACTRFQDCCLVFAEQEGDP